MDAGVVDEGQHMSDSQYIIARLSFNHTLTEKRNQNVIITGRKIVVASIRTIWTRRVRGPVHVQDMALLSHTVLSIFRKENGGNSI